MVNIAAKTIQQAFLIKKVAYNQPCLILFAIILSIIGLLRSIKKLKGPKTKRRMFSLFAGGFLICVLLYLIIDNIVNAIKYLT